MPQLNPYMTFNGNCRAAMTFYQECLGGELILQTFGEAPMSDQLSAEIKERILHSSLMSNGMALMASDMMGSEPVVQGNTISLSLNCNSDEEINNFFSKLSSGGQITSPLKVEFWGAVFGMFTDQFGMHWLLNYQKNPQS